MKLQNDAHCSDLLCWAPPARNPIVLKKPWECDRCLSPFARNKELRLVSGNRCQGCDRCKHGQSDRHYRGADGQSYRKRKSPSHSHDCVINQNRNKKNDTIGQTALKGFGVECYPFIQYCNMPGCCGFLLCMATL